MQEQTFLCSCGEVIALLDEIDRLNAQRRIDMAFVEETLKEVEIVRFLTKDLIELYNGAVKEKIRLNAEVVAMRDALELLRNNELPQSCKGCRFDECEKGGDLFDAINKTVLSANAGCDMLERVEKLEAVADAAKNLRGASSGNNELNPTDAWGMLLEALDALDGESNT